MGRDVPESAYSTNIFCARCGAEMMDLMGDDICPNCDEGGYAPAAPWQTGYPGDGNAILAEVENELNELAKDAGNTQALLLEMFSAAYYKFTGIDPRDAVLIRQTTEDGMKWWFERRDERS